MSRPHPLARGLLDLGAFLAELALLAALVVTALHTGAPFALRVVLAVTLPVALAVVWGRWLAPRAPRRLARTGRVVVKVLLALAVSGALAASGWEVAGAALGVLAAALLAAGEMADRA